MHYTNFSQVLLLSLGFQLLFTAWFTTQNFASKVLYDDGFGDAGYTSVALLYFVFGISSFFGAVVVNRIGSLPISMFLGCLCFSGFIVSFILASLYDECPKAERKDLPLWLEKDVIV